MNSLIEEFRLFMSTLGLGWAGEIIGDGKLHRFRCEGDKEDSSWYVLHGNSQPVAGVVGCWKRGLKETWCYRNGDTAPLAGRDLAQARIRWAQAEAERDKEEAARHERGCSRAAEFLSKCGSVELNHPYLTKKHAGVYGGARLSPAGEIVLPLVDAAGKLWSYQTIDAEGAKLFMVSGRVKGCFYVVCDRIDGPLVVCEGYATGATIHEATGFATICALNCGNLMEVCTALRKKNKTRKILIAADDDRYTLDNSGSVSNPGLTKAKEAAKNVSALVVVPEIKGEGTDFNDMACESGLNSVLAVFEKSCPSPLSLLTFDQISLIPNSEADRILGEHVLDRGSSMTIIGAGGTGKSRLALQLIAAIIGGKERFLNMEIHPGARNMKWMVFQAENSARRLRKEGESLKNWLSHDGDYTWNKFNENVRILTPINEIDTFLNLDNPENLTRLQASMDWFMPDGVIFDSLYDFGTGELSKDSDMRNSLIALSRLCRYRNPKRALVLLHHSLTGAAGAARSTGYDRSSFARNSKVIFNWTRCQINVAPMREDDNSELAISCGKLSDGKEFQPFAIRLNPDTLIYECDETLDVKAWADEMKGKKSGELVSPSRVRELCNVAGSAKLELSKSIQNDCGCTRSNSYRYIARAEKEGEIALSSEKNIYFRG